jgi:hypothetical protein
MLEMNHKRKWSQLQVGVDQEKIIVKGALPNRFESLTRYL